MDIKFDLGDLDLLFKEQDDFDSGELGTLTQLMDIPTQQLVNNQSTSTRFSDPVSSSDIKIQQQAGVPKKTRQANNWTLNLWKDWARHRNARPETLLEMGPNVVIPEDICLLSDCDLNFWMQRFIVEIRRKDGSEYPPNTLTQIVAGLQRHLRSVCVGRQINFFKEEDLFFREFRKTLDARMKLLTSQGIGVDKKRADPVTEADEKKMWETGVFSMDTASGLSNAIFFYNGKAFAFRGMEEHRQCVAEQFQILFDHENNQRYIQYTPRVTKNVQGGLKHRRVEINPIKHYENPANPRCLVRLYDMYLSLIPSRGPLYRKPLESVSSFGPRFSAGTIPVNQMSQMFKRFFAEAGIDTTGRTISNHSGRVTCCTRLYNDGYSDKAVISRSSHRSNAVHAYQREQFKILSDISNTLGAPHPHVKSEELVRAENAEKENKRPADITTDSTVKLVLPDSVEKVVLIKGDRKIEVTI